MKAMIFAAGKGERMLPLTRDLPKPLLTINNKMLIEYHLEKLAATGISEVIINVAWMGDKIVQALGQGERYGLNILYSVEPEPLETAGAIKYAQALVGDEHLLVVNADVFTSFDFSTLLNLSFNEEELGTLVLVNNPQHNPGGDFKLDDEGYVQTKAELGKNLTFAGVSVLNPRWVYGFSSAHKKLPLREVFASAISQKKLRGMHYQGQWSDVGTPERLAELRERF
jgi:MurNAc alpha-1-phosphate uridylyltransferase